MRTLNGSDAETTERGQGNYRQVSPGRSLKTSVQITRGEEPIGSRPRSPRKRRGPPHQGQIFRRTSEAGGDYGTGEKKVPRSGVGDVAANLVAALRCSPSNKWPADLRELSGQHRFHIKANLWPLEHCHDLSDRKVIDRGIAPV